MKRYSSTRAYALMSAIAMSVVASPAGWSQSLTWLGTLGGGSSWARGVSADGSVVVGEVTLSARRAFRWTATTGMQDLGTFGGHAGEAYGVSVDGSVIAGSAHNANGFWRAFRWTETGGMQDLGTLSGPHPLVSSSAYGVSADGTTVVGRSITDFGKRRAFRWTQATGIQPLYDPSILDNGAYGVSADGSVIVGWSINIVYENATRWTQDGMEHLGTLGGCCSEAYAVSGDGNVVVGYAWNALNQHRAFRWRQDTGMIDLGTLGRSSFAYGVSADGATVVGRSITDSGKHHAFRWRENRGIENLNVTYASLLTGDSYLEEATAISPDGRYIVGRGYNAATGRWEGYLLDTAGAPPQEGDVNGDGCVDDSDLLAVLFAFGNSGGAEDLNNDGVVDDADLLTVLFNFGSGC